MNNRISNNEPFSYWVDKDLLRWPEAYVARYEVVYNTATIDGMDGLRIPSVRQVVSETPKPKPQPDSTARFSELDW